MFDDVPTIDLNVARSIAAEELANQLSRGIHWGPCQDTLRRKCAIIDAMTPDERREFADGICNARIAQIAEDAGVDRADVVDLIDGYTMLAEVIAEEFLCQCSHGTVVAGRCSWCDEEVVRVSLPMLEEVCTAPPPLWN